MKLIWLAVFAVIYAHLPARAGVIDFEGLPDNIAITSPISTGDNQVTFSCGFTPNTENCSSFHYGGMINAFAPTEIPVGGFGDGTAVGFVGLNNAGHGANEQDDFFFQFDEAITSLSFDFIDAEVIGRTHFLTLFSDRDFSNVVGATSFTVPANVVDEDIVNIGLTLSGTTALSAIFTNSNDIGVAVDNLNFTTAPVPEPGSIGGLGLGLLSIAIANWRRRKSVI